MRRQLVAWTTGAIALGWLFLELGASDVDRLTLSPAAVADLPPSTGLFFTIELLCWVSSATALLLAAALLRRAEGEPDRVAWLGTTGLLALMSMLDDGLRVHQTVAPQFGMPQGVVYAFYGLVVVIWLVRFWAQVLRSNVALLGLAAGALGTSLLLDVLGEATGPAGVVQEYTKLLGTATFLAYAIGLAWKQLGNEEAHHPGRLIQAAHRVEEEGSRT